MLWCSLASWAVSNGPTFAVLFTCTLLLLTENWLQELCGCKMHPFCWLVSQKIPQIQMNEKNKYVYHWINLYCGHSVSRFDRNQGERSVPEWECCFLWQLASRLDQLECQIVASDFEMAGPDPKGLHRFLPCEWSKARYRKIHFIGNVTLGLANSCLNKAFHNSLRLLVDLISVRTEASFYQYYLIRFNFERNMFFCRLQKIVN